METLKIGNFIFEVNKTKTKITHDNRVSATIECGCGNCKEFNKNRDKIFSKELIKLLEKFGLDYKKEDYFANYGDEANPPYEILYYVKGRIINNNKEDFYISSDTHLVFEDKDLPKNFLPKGLNSPYFMISVWFKDTK